MMKRKLSALSQRYATELKKHLGPGPRAGLQSAQGWGRRAVTIGLETLDRPRMHDGALGLMETSGDRDGIIARAKSFFAEAIAPIEATHQAALKTKDRLRSRNQTLGRHRVELAASNRSLQRGIEERKIAEKALQASETLSRRLHQEIACTRRLVDESLDSIKQFARKFDKLYGT